MHITGRGVAHGDSLPVTLRRTGAGETRDQALWAAIRNRTKAISFASFDTFMGRFLAGASSKVQDCVFQNTGMLTFRSLGFVTSSEPGLNLHGVLAYDVLRMATEVFLALECGVVIGKDGKPVPYIDDHTPPAPFDEMDESSRLGRPATYQQVHDQLAEYLTDGDAKKLPYLKRIVRSLGGGVVEEQDPYLRYYTLVLNARVQHPALLELIWSYWQEEGMLVQSINAIALRFQNKRRNGRDPLADLEIDPLRPLNNLLWGHIQAEYKRLTVQRRAYEYDHHYGLPLYGKAVPPMRAADSRSKFLEAFHNLLFLCSVFYREDADTTVVADAFPLLNALKEVHLILAEGAHNQFGDLPWTARIEMLIEQWLLSRPEMREFLHGRAMVPYKEPWMGQVDAMRKLQGWGDTSITHFHDLAAFGEQILLSVRYGDWIDVNSEDNARNWARYWKPEIQGYIHDYRAVTGVDLAAEVSDTGEVQRRFLPPAVLLRNQLTARRQPAMAALPSYRR
ncbi:MAG: hypothetical protein U1E42_16390 [Rhodospirillales bacterium]